MADHPTECAACASLDAADQEAYPMLDPLLDGMCQSLIVAGLIGDMDVNHPTGAGVGPCSEPAAKLLVETIEHLALGKPPPIYVRNNAAHGRSTEEKPPPLPDWCVLRASYGPMPGFPGQFRVEIAVQNKETAR